MTKEDGFLTAFAVFAGVFALCMIAYGSYIIAVDSRCLRAGWPHGRVTLSLEPFCVKRVNQTDVVVPLSEAK